MGYLVFAPEINSALMFAGEGSGPLLAAGLSWDGLAEELSSAASSFGAVTSGLAGGPWQGPASAAMAAVSERYTAWLSAAAARAQGVGVQAKAVAALFETARAATVYPGLVAANRSRLVT